MKEGGEKPRGARMVDKAGWIKKNSGGLLGLWKDRYLLLCQAQLLVYENEDEQKCVETVELGSYEKCQDLRALLKRKHRFILLRSPGNKVSDIKFQATSGEEKESWIKALNEGINRGKNKAFDEVRCSPVDGTASPCPPCVITEKTLSPQPQTSPRLQHCYKHWGICYCYLC